MSLSQRGDSLDFEAAVFANHFQGGRAFKKLLMRSFDLGYVKCPLMGHFAAAIACPKTLCSSLLSADSSGVTFLCLRKRWTLCFSFRTPAFFVVRINR
jgi:hypothetical protein